MLSVTHTVIAQHSHREDETEHEHPPSVAAATYDVTSRRDRELRDSGH